MKLKVSLSNKIFFIFISVVTISVASVAWYGYASAKKSYIDSAFEINSQRVASIAFKIQEELFPVIKDVEFMTNAYSLNRYMIWKDLNEEKKTKQYESIYSDSIEDMLKSKKIYRKIRIFDTESNELLVSTYNNKTNKVSMVSKSKLQNKSGRNYIEVAKGLNDGEFYISELNLNVENSKILKPYLPVLRYSTPLINQNKEYRGLFVASLYAQGILDIVDSKMKELKGKGISFYLLDKDSNYIYHKDKLKRWNSQLSNGYTFTKDFFNIKNMTDVSKVFIKDEKIYSYHKVYPSKKFSDDYWYVVSVVDTNIALSKLDSFKLIFIIVLFSVILISFILIKFFVSKLINPLEKITIQLKALSRGEIKREEINYKDNDEIGEIVKSTALVLNAIEDTILQAESVSKGDFSSEIQLLSDKDSLGFALMSMTKRLRDVANQANKIANGDFTSSIEIKSESDKLGKSLKVMNDTLRKNRLKNEADIFFSDGITSFNGALVGLSSNHEVMKNAINEICSYIKASSGVCYKYDSSSKSLAYEASYAFAVDNDNRHIEIGNGFIGQVAQDKKSMHIKDLKAENFIIRSSLGSIIPVEIYIVPILNKDGLYGVIELASIKEFSDLDIKYINRACEVLALIIETTNKNMQIKDLLVESEKSYKELSRASEYKSEFLANMSHELRTPLNSIILLSKLLAKNTNNNLYEADISKMSVINKAGNDLLLLINDILDLSKIESGNIELLEMKTHTGDIIDELRGLFDIVAKEKNLDFNINDNFEDSLVLDNVKLLQILKNLLSNAFKFTSEGSVSLNVRAEERYVVFEVEDTGLGIAKDKLSMIFEAFKQVDGSISRNYGGTGLGLSISKSFTDIMGGEIKVSSIENKGSTFTIYIPLKQYFDKKKEPKIDAVKSIEKEIIQDNSLAGKNILIVDDDSKNIFTLSALLQNIGAEIYTSMNGEEALELLHKNNCNIDVVLMDIMMPIMNGIEAIKAIRECNHCKNVPIIAITAKVSKEDEKICYDAGADDYVPKPIDDNLLISKIIKRSL